MNHKEYLAFHNEFTDRLRSLAEKRSKSEDHPFKEFTFIEDIGVCSALYGYLVGKSERFRKVVSFIKDGQDSTSQEVIEDLLVDEANFNIMLAGYLRATRTTEDLPKPKKTIHRDKNLEDNGRASVDNSREFQERLARKPPTRPSDSSIVY